MNRVIGVKMCSYAQTHQLMLGTNVVVEDFFKDFVTVQYTHLMTLEKKGLSVQFSLTTQCQNVHFDSFQKLDVSLL